MAQPTPTSPISSRPVLVTGLTGYIGSRIAIQLLKKGYAVRGTMRNPAKLERVRADLAEHAPLDRLTAVKADLLDAASWTEATRGVDYVLHVASPFFASLPKDPDELIGPAREGTLNVLRAATANGVKKVVLTSSMAAVAYGLDASPGQPLDETRWSDPEHPDNTPYVRSKTIAEKAAWEYVRSTPGAPILTTVNPGAVLGPLISDNASDSLLIVQKMLKGEFPGIPKLGFMMVDVRDVADLHVRALESEAANGERFLAGGHFETMEEVAALLRREFPDYAGKLPKRKLPNWLLRIAGLFDADTRGIMVEIGKERRVTSAKAERLLGWSYRPAAEAVVATGRDLVGRGMV